MTTADGKSYEYLDISSESDIWDVRNGVIYNIGTHKYLPSSLEIEQRLSDIRRDHMYDDVIIMLADDKGKIYAFLILDMQGWEYLIDHAKVKPISIREIPSHEISNLIIKD